MNAAAMLEAAAAERAEQETLELRRIRDRIPPLFWRRVRQEVAALRLI